MKTFIVGLISFSILTVRAQEVEYIDLQTCIDYALEHALSMRQAKIDLLQIKKDYKAALAMGLPQITAKANFTDNAIIPVTFIPATGFATFTGQNSANVSEDDPDVQLTLGTRFVPGASIKLTQVVIDGKYFIGLQAFKSLHKLKEQMQEKTKVDLIYQITKIYYTILINQERYKSFKANLTRLDTLLVHNQLLLKNGYALRVDVKRLKVNYNNLKNECQKLEYAIQTAKNALKLQIGMSIEKVIELTQTIDTAQISQLQLINEDFHFDRINYKLLKMQRTLNGFNIKKTKADYYPKLLFETVYGYNGGGVNLDAIRFSNYAFWGVRLDIPIFDGFQKRSEIQKLHLEDQKINFAIESMERNIRFEQEQTILNFKSTYQDLNNQRENQSLAQEVYDLTLASYQEGLSSSSDLIIADTSYKESQNNYYVALLNLLLARLEYDKAFGKLENQ